MSPSAHKLILRTPISRVKKNELASNVEFEQDELAQIYVARGVEHNLAKKVAMQLMAHDALGTHAREELGITETLRARPIQAAFSSAGSFALGATLPLILVLVSPPDRLIMLVSVSSLIFLILLGVIAARVGGANVWKGAFRVAFWGAFAMAATAGIGTLFGTTAL